MKEKVQNENQWLRLSSLAASLALAVVAASPNQVQAQEQEQSQQQTLYYACYVPEVGAMYLIRLSGLPSDCLSTNHQLITWNEEGAEGPQGEQGIQGTEGSAGLSCWDLNGDGVKDLGEDTNGDGAWDAQDCQGEQGPPGEGGEIPDGSVTTIKLADNAVTSAKILDGTVTNADLAANSITTDKILGGTITDSDLASNSVGAAEIQTDAVGSLEIASGAVRSSEIATGAVGSSEVADNSLTAADLASNSVTSSEIASGAVSLDVSIKIGSSITVAAGTSESVNLTCDPGYTAIAGGWFLLSGSALSLVVLNSYPDDADTWTLSFYNDGSSSLSVLPHLRCLRLSM